jgi:filamentous hemagglutinin
VEDPEEKERLTSLYEALRIKMSKKKGGVKS